VAHKGWADAGHDREPRVSVRRSIFPIVNDLDRRYFGAEDRSQDQVGFIDGGIACFGKTYAGEPQALVEQLAGDEAIATADTVLLTIPDQLGVDHCAHVIDSILRDVAPGSAGAELRDVGEGGR
jgi:alkanesulfonate monooxygenase SsuD/methylene tetrahydromethanopterin reductase-like flavin-dependent oxidoreductase (luciferase family)